MTTATVNEVARALRKLLPAKLPPTLAGRPGNLYQVLSRHPGVGIGRRVYQTRWSQKKIYDCYWEITRARFKCEGNNGKAWGKLYWRGRLTSDKETRIPGGLKYLWAEGVSNPAS